MSRLNSTSQRFLSVRAKLISPLLAISVVVFALGTAGFALGSRQIIDVLARQRAEGIANAVNLAAEQLEPNALQRFVASLGAERDIERIVVFGGKDWAILATTRFAWLGKPLSELPQDEFLADIGPTALGGHVERHFHKAEHQLDYLTPFVWSRNAVDSERRSVVAITLNTRLIESQLSQQIALGGSLALLPLVSIIGIAFLSLRSIVLRPLAALDQLIKDQAAGKTASRVSSLPADEIGNLGRAMNGLLDQLEERQARLQAVIHDAVDGVIVIDTRGRIETFNRAAEAMFGYSADEIVGQNIAKLMPSPHAENHNDYLSRFRSTGEARVLGRGRDLAGLRRDGQPFPIEVSVNDVRIGGQTLYVGFIRDISERVAREGALRKLQSLQQAAFANTTYVMVATDTEGTITLFNRAAEKLLGYTAEETVGKLCPAIWHDPDELLAYAAELSKRFGEPMQPCFDTFVARAVREGKPDERQWTIITKDGRRIPTILSLNAIRDQEGELTGFVGVGYDVSEQLRTRRALEESEQRFRGLFELSPVGKVLIDANGRFIEANAAMEKLTGYSRERLGSLTFPEITPPEFADIDSRNFQQLLQEGRCGPFEKEYLRADGSRVPITVRAVRVPGNNGQDWYWAIITDETERLQSERTLRESELRFRTLADAAPVLIWMSGTDKGCHYFNQTWLDFTGRSLEQESGDGWAEGVHPDDLERCLRIYLDSFDRREAFEMEYRLRRHDGAYRWLLDKGQPRYLTDGSFAGYIGSCIDITERRETEDELALMQERFSLAASAGELGVWDYDPITDRLWWSEHMFPVFGVDPASFGGKFVDWRQCVLPEDLAPTERLFQLALEQDSPFDTEFRIRWPDGQIRYLRGVAQILRDEDGRAVRVNGVNYDVTPQRQAEAAAIESRRQRQAVISAIDDVVVEIDADRRFVNCWSDHPERLFLQPAAFMGRRPSDVFPDGQGKEMEKLVARVLATGEAASFDYAAPSAGTHRWLNAKLTRLSEQNSDARRVVAVIRDITERKIAEESLRESEDRLRQISDNLPNGAIYHAISSADGRFEFRYVSAGIEKLFGVPSDEVLDNASALYGLVYSEDVEELNATRDRSRQAMQPFSHGFRHWTRDGQLLWVRIHAAPRRATDDAIYWDGIIIDETAAREAEEELRRTRDAANAAARAKTEFLANMSHEIRTPLNGVIGVTDLLLDSRLDPEQREHAELIRGSGEHLLSLVNEILDFSKIEAGHSELENIDFDLAEVLEQAVGLWDARAHEKRLLLTYHIDADLPRAVRGDPRRLQQIVLNLIGNAVKFTQQGGIDVRASLVSSGDDDDIVARIDVADSGVGIDADRIQDLFNPFVQADTSTTRRYGGTGLGLAISRRLAELMHGEIGVHSELGEGSTFWFTARLSLAEAPFETTDLNGRTLAIASASAELSEAVQRLLDERFGAITQLSSTAELLDCLNQDGARRLFLVDERMPGAVAAVTTWATTLEPDAPRALLLTEDKVQSGGTPPPFGACLKQPVRQSPLIRAIRRLAGPTAHETATLTVEPSLNQASPRILVVDDHPVNRLIATRLLAKLGCQTDTANDGLQALAQLRDGHFDLVLMDCQMPEMDGYAAARAIRDPATGVNDPTVPIIAMTANAMPEDRDKCLRVGMNDYLAKPVSADALTAALRHWLDQFNWLTTTSAPTPVQPEPEHAVFARDELLERVQGDTELADAIQEAFAEEAPTNLERLRNAIDGENAEQIRKGAHVIKGAAANVGGLALERAASELEHAALSGSDPTTLRGLAEQVHRAADRLLSELASSRAEGLKRTG